MLVVISWCSVMCPTPDSPPPRGTCLNYANPILNTSTAVRSSPVHGCPPAIYIASGRSPLSSLLHLSLDIVCRTSLYLINLTSRLSSSCLLLLSSSRPLAPSWSATLVCPTSRDACSELATNVRSIGDFASMYTPCRLASRFNQRVRSTVENCVS